MPTKWEKIFPNNKTNKGLDSKIYKQLNIQKTNNPIKKWAEDKTDIFPKTPLDLVFPHQVCRRTASPRNNDRAKKT